MQGDALDEAREMLSTEGMLLTQPIPSSVGPYRRELLETRRVLAALAAELEAARAVVEHVREERGVCLWRHASADGRASCGRCDNCRTDALVAAYDAAVQR